MGEKAAPNTEVGKLRIKKIPGAKHEVMWEAAMQSVASTWRIVWRRNC